MTARYSHLHDAALKKASQLAGKIVTEAGAREEKKADVVNH
jgi:hypothetical protein